MVLRVAGVGYRVSVEVPMFHEWVDLAYLYALKPGLQARFSAKRPSSI
jgi:hypothetical protein